MAAKIHFFYQMDGYQRPTILVFAIYEYNQLFSYDIQYSESKFGDSSKDPLI